MFNTEEIDKIISAILVADAYSLGAHWIYDENQLKSLPIDWDGLNAPQAMWHKGKTAGDFTHIGDQAYWLKEYVSEQKSFNSKGYLDFWKDKMDSYEGYIDGATRETLENIKNGDMIGSDSHDFSVVGRIAPLLYVSKNKEDFLKNVQELVKLSHNNKQVLECADFFAKLMLRVKEGKNIEEEMLHLSDDFSAFISDGVQKGISSKKEDSFKAIRDFGPACGVEDCFSGVVHLLAKYSNDLRTLLIQNAKAGGDSSSRAMTATMIISANRQITELPKSWYDLLLHRANT
jgi:ADP-ribosylglycohydrolase